MNQFDQHVEHRIDRIKQTMQVKAKEYLRNDNPFHNFDQAAKADDVTPERALIGMMRKHEVSIRDIVNDIDSGKYPDLNVVAEKISDNVNYLILLEGLIKRRCDTNIIWETLLDVFNAAGLSVKKYDGLECTHAEIGGLKSVTFLDGTTYYSLEEEE